MMKIQIGFRELGALIRDRLLTEKKMARTVGAVEETKRLKGHFAHSFCISRNACFVVLALAIRKISNPFCGNIPQ